MATRSTIAILHNDGTVQSIYCHWDGYISNNGLLLHQHYTQVTKVKELISLGNISSLREQINPPDGKEHNYTNPLSDVTIFYGRDRGEKEQRAITCDCLAKYLNDGNFEEFNYIFKEKNNTWYLLNDNKKLNKLESIILKDSSIDKEIKNTIKNMRTAKKLAASLDKVLVEKTYTKKLKV